MHNINIKSIGRAMVFSGLLALSGCWPSSSITIREGIGTNQVDLIIGKKPFIHREKVSYQESNPMNESNKYGSNYY